MDESHHGSTGAVGAVLVPRGRSADRHHAAATAVRRRDPIRPMAAVGCGGCRCA